MSNIKSKQWWALVKWVGGHDDKKMTAGINVRHIKNFAVKEFQQENHDPQTVYVVEWHDTIKEPLGGWKCYEAIVIDVSKSLESLEKKLNALEGVKSPGPSVKPQEVLNNNSDDDCITEINNDDESNDKDSRRRLLFSGARTIHEIDPKVITLSENQEIPVNSVTSRSKEVKSKDEHEYSSKDNVTAGGSQGNKRSNAISNSERNSKKIKLNKSQKNKELGHEGSGIWISREQWNEAKSKPSFAAMTASLLTSVFPKEVLLKSNYKGGASKNTENKEMKYEALDSNLLNAIKEAVKERHDDFKNGPFGTAVNNTCGKARSELKKQQQNAKKEVPEID